MAYKKKSFMKGWMHVQQGQVKEVRKALMDALKISAYASWYLRLRGKYDFRVSEVESITNVFANYGITDVWDDIEIEKV
jgi:hypothetical protein